MAAEAEQQRQAGDETAEPKTAGPTRASRLLGKARGALKSLPTGFSHGGDEEPRESKSLFLGIWRSLRRPKEDEEPPLVEEDAALREILEEIAAEQEQGKNRVPEPDAPDLGEGTPMNDQPADQSMIDSLLAQPSGEGVEASGQEDTEAAQEIRIDADPMPATDQSAIDAMLAQDDEDAAPAQPPVPDQGTESTPSADPTPAPDQSAIDALLAADHEGAAPAQPPVPDQGTESTPSADPTPAPDQSAIDALMSQAQQEAAPATPAPQPPTAAPAPPAKPVPSAADAIAAAPPGDLSALSSIIDPNGLIGKALRGEPVQDVELVAPQAQAAAAPPPPPPPSPVLQPEPASEIQRLEQRIVGETNAGESVHRDPSDTVTQMISSATCNQPPGARCHR